MIQALLEGQNDDKKPSTSILGAVTDSNEPVEADIDESDEQTIRKRSVESYRPSSQLQVWTVGGSQSTEAGFSAEVHQDLQPQSVSHSKSLDRLSASVSPQREKSGQAKVRKQAYREQLQIPVLLHLNRRHQ